MTQQPRTPTPEMNNRESATVTYETHRRLLDEARADLLAQIEKAVLGLPGSPWWHGDSALDSGPDGVYIDRAAVLAAIRSAAPVEPVTHDEIATLAVAAAAASSLPVDAP